MTRVLRPLGTGLAMVLLMTAVLGVLYPVAMTGVRQGLFPDKADGSLVKVDGSVVGTDLAGQEFTSPLYFHSRPSATTPPYNPSATTFANLGPNTVALKDAVDANIAAALKLERPVQPGPHRTGPAGGHGHDVRLGRRPGHHPGERAPAGEPHRRRPLHSPRASADL